jgi:hypothetical protein
MSMTESGSRSARPGLAQLLIENKLISEAQADLAVGDQEITGMSFDEVLLLRGWIDRDTLYKIAPWLKSGPQNANSEILEISTSIGTSYQENLKVYRRLIEKILGKGWD